MTDRVHPPVSATLATFRAWCRKNGGTLERIRHKGLNNISIRQGGMHHVFIFDKGGKGDGEYGWSSSFAEDFLARATAAYLKANPEPKP